MNGDNVFKVFNIFTLWFGIVLCIIGITQMGNSGYVPPTAPFGWAMGMFWIGFGGTIGCVWTTHTGARLIEQKCLGGTRWTLNHMASSSLFLIAGMGCAILGTYYTWRHPFRIGFCGCLTTEWGLQCTPCQCVHGLCHSGTYGSGSCSCDPGWTGVNCDRCDDRHKPEPDGSNVACDLCKTGYTGERCEECAVGYTGEECDICDLGWQPWQHRSALFSETIADDDRHICDECRPNHWGYYCKSCPYGRDVPHLTLDRNDPIVVGESRVADKDKRPGTVYALQIWTDMWKDGFPDPDNPLVLKHTRLRLQYDDDGVVSGWLLFQDIQGFQCNNRGTCMDDATHQLRNPDWEQTCTASGQECTINDDCKVSQNCKGICQGLDLPISFLWTVETSGNICSDDTDCRGPAIDSNDDGLVYYTGGRCVARFCCEESYHGDGICDCADGFFGPVSDNGIQPHHKMSPGCDFCPGYDWLTEEPSSICSGGKGTCAPDYASSGVPGVKGEYLQMKCNCGAEMYIDPETGIVDVEREIFWGGNLCHCGDFNNNNPSGQCDICASGHWGKLCGMCPGGAGSKQCSGHGTCNSGVDGDGTCTCDIDRVSSWMLAEYVPRFSGDCATCENSQGDTRTCNECAPNFWGEQCLRCEDTAMIKPSELELVFQPEGSYAFGIGQSSAKPQGVCHPEHPSICTLACGGGGWCNWGRGGDGTCMCWSNKRRAKSTWNPLDNVCMGNERYSGSNYDGTGGEICPSYGRCGNAGAECGPTGAKFLGGKDMSINDNSWDGYKNWAGNLGSRQKDSVVCAGEWCNAWRKIDWRPTNSLLTCQADN